MTFETVGTDTPAAPATSAMVTRPLPFSGRDTVENLPEVSADFREFQTSNTAG
jgi:hypothetical protein